MKQIFKKICIASDHAGYKFKESIKEFLIQKNISIIDLGPANENSVDYPDYAMKVSRRIVSKKSLLLSNFFISFDIGSIFSTKI